MILPRGLKSRAQLEKLHNGDGAASPHIDRRNYRNMSAEIGQSAPDFTLPDQSGNQVSLGQFQGEKNVVLSFYVFDFTGG